MVLLEKSELKSWKVFRISPLQTTKIFYSRPRVRNSSGIYLANRYIFMKIPIRNWILVWKWVTRQKQKHNAHHILCLLNRDHLWLENLAIAPNIEASILILTEVFDMCSCLLRSCSIYFITHCDSCRVFFVAGTESIREECSRNNSSISHPALIVRW